jgi:hypothetical protein
MKTTASIKNLIALGLVLASAGTFAQTAISGSISINQPGVYGRVDFGQAPPPPPVALVYPQPVMIAPPPVAVVQPPLYLYVPPGHQRDWAHHCGYYHACGRPVYFVQERWVRERYEGWQHDHDRHYEHDYYDHDRDHGRDEDRGRDDDHDHGRGHGHGHDRD